MAVVALAVTGAVVCLWLSPALALIAAVCARFRGWSLLRLMLLLLLPLIAVAVPVVALVVAMVAVVVVAFAAAAAV